jgi:hypothetical protein
VLSAGGGASAGGADIDESGAAVDESAGGGVVSGVVVESGVVVFGVVAESLPVDWLLRGPHAANSAADAQRGIRIFVLMNAPLALTCRSTVRARTRHDSQPPQGESPAPVPLDARIAYPVISAPN